MNNSPEVSVIIPTYNSARTILDTLQSIFQQTHQDFEIILINDGSTDDLIDLLSNIQDPRLKIFNYENEGLFTARNRGIDHASGDYIIFLDADVLWTSDKLESHIYRLKKTRRFNPRAGVVYSLSYFFDDEAQSCFIDQPQFYEGNVLAKILESNFITNGSNSMMTREAIDSVGYFNPDFQGEADWEYWIRLARKWDYLLVPQRQIFCRQRQQSMPSRIEPMKYDPLYILERAFSNGASYHSISSQIAHQVNAQIL